MPVEARTSPVVSSSNLMHFTIPKGETVTVVSVIGEWCQIRYKINNKLTDCYIVKRKTDL